MNFLDETSKAIKLTGTLLLMGLVMALFSGCWGGGNNQDAEQLVDAQATPSQQTQELKAPAESWSLHLKAKNVLPGNPDMSVDKYCKSVVGNMTECQIYESNDADARLVGMEVIVGNEMYSGFSAAEQKNWVLTKDLMQQTSVAMPDLSAEQFTNVAQSFAGNYSKVYLLWDPGKINLPTGNPVVTVANMVAATGTTLVTAGKPATPAAIITSSTQASSAAESAITSGGFKFAAFDIAKIVAAGLETKKGNFESSVLQRNDAGSVELYRLKDRIGLHQYDNTTHVMFIISGKGEFTVGDKKQAVSGGMVVIIPNGTPHAFKNTEGKDSPLVFVTFKTPYDEQGVKWLE